MGDRSPTGAAQRPGRAVGIDLGSRRVGVAVSDSAQTVALPHTTLSRSRDAEKDRRSLVELIVDLEAAVVVVGLPLSLDGSHGPAAEAATVEAEALAAALAEHGIPVELVDERLTTVSAHRALAEAGARERNRRRVVDASAAAVVLTTWLDAARVAFVSETQGPDAGPRPVPEAPPPGAAPPGAAPLDGAAPEAPPIYGRPDDSGAGEGVGPRSARRRARRRRWRLVALAVAVAILIVLVGGFLWVNSEANPSGPMGAQVVVTVGPGAGADGVSSELAARSVIGSSFAYRIWSQLHSTPDVEPGQYAFNQNSSFGTVDRILSAGPNVFPITVPPGFTVSELAQRIGQLPGHSTSDFEAVATSGAVHSPWQPAGSTNLDGLLGTGVYTVVPGETDRELLTKMVDRFNSEADALGLAAGSARLGYSPYQVVTMASIVEKEGVIQKNLGPVARVVLNRLAAGMPLQMDSTVLYSEGRDGGPVTEQDLQRNTPYNTYLHTGLTPTPVCFPSLASLRATLDPPPGSWLYFVVVQKDGTEAFSDTLAQQKTNEAVAKANGAA